MWIFWLIRIFFSLRFSVFSTVYAHSLYTRYSTLAKSIQYLHRASKVSLVVMYFCWTMYYIQIIQIKTKIVDILNNWRCLKYLAKRLHVLRVCIQTPTQCLLIPGIHEKFGGILTLIMMILLEHTPRVNACFSSYN